MKIHFLLYLLLICQTILLSQNLIPNHSFELTKQQVDSKIAASQDDFNQKAAAWYSPSDASPDIYQVPTDNANYPPNFKLPEPPDGKGLVGLILNTPASNQKCKNYKEYIQVKLNKPLEVDTTYVLEFWIYGKTPGRYRLGAHFSKEAIYSQNCGVLVQNPSQTIYNDILNEARWGKWKKVVYGFTATSADVYLTIGNFSKEALKKNQYCYLDNLYLAKYDPQTEQKAKQKIAKKKEKTLKEFLKETVPQRVFFNPNNIHFEHGLAALTEASQTELDRLVVDLQQDTTLSLLVVGHTDNSGSPTFNQKLAINRAMSVQQYLVSKGIAATRIKAVGYGASRPIADNDTVEGAQKNRRVEFLLSDNVNAP